MILLLGASGYIGEAFAREMRRRGMRFVPVSRGDADYTRFDQLRGLLDANAPELVINAAGYTGKPNVDACEDAKADTLMGNAVLPHTIACACAAAGVPWGHVSSGCIYSGGKIIERGAMRVENNLNAPGLRELIERSPAAVQGFTEADPPNFSFRNGPCSFYSGSKALGEDAIAGIGRSYVWRLRIPFDEFDHARNYLSKIQRYPKVYDNVNSISHRADFVKVCLDLWQARAPFGIYNVTNPGFVTSRQVIARIEKQLKPGKKFAFWENDDEFYRMAAKTPRSNCVMDASKLLKAGIKIRSVEEALEDALKNWKKEEA